MNESWKTPIDLAMDMIEENEKRRQILTGKIALIISKIILTPLIVTLIWNVIIPELFDLPELVYWKALLLVVLIRFLI